MTVGNRFIYLWGRMRDEDEEMMWGNFNVLKYSEGNSYPWEMVASDEIWEENDMNYVEFLDLLKVTEVVVEASDKCIPRYIEKEVTLTDEEINVYKQKFKIKGD